MSEITKRIGSIKFACLSPDEIRKMSAVKVITADTYDDEGYPLEGGLMDTHMGVIEPGIRCKKCGCKVNDCPGHFGHIELARPVIHVGFIKEIKMLLESTCSSCGRLMLSEDQIKSREEEMSRLDELGGDNLDKKNFTKKLAKSAMSEICPYCGQKQKKIKLDKPTTFREVDDNHKLTPQEVRERLERIKDEDLKALGIDPSTCRPEWMVIQVLAVPPVTVRPSITLESFDRSEDDLTHKLVDVLRINQRLRENRDAGAPQLIIEDLWELLQYHITTYFDNQTSGIPPARHRSGRPLKTLTQRLKGKEGRFRSNLSGKRVNFSARTVISPDPLLSINDVGVPIFAARELTVPIHVNENNIEMCKKLVLRGLTPTDENGKYIPGVNYLVKPDGQKKKIIPSLNLETVVELMTPGYTIERQLMDGDVVLFNRQPSLHRMSMMAHRVKIMEGNTFRFNLCVCPPYNADFDGDEMNLHVLQGEEARAEARIIMQVQENILSPRYGGPIIGAIHDHITGAYFLTHNNPRFYKKDGSAMRVLTKLDGIKIPEPFVDENGDEYWTGKQLFSIILPKEENGEAPLNMTFKANICHMCPKDGKACAKENCEYDAFVKIRNGELVCGTIDVKAIGNSKGKILERIARDYGSSRACQFINQVTRIALGALMNRGFSTGIDDEDIPQDAKYQIISQNEEAVQKVDDLIASYRDGTLEARPGRTKEETLEIEVKGVLADARDNTGRVAEKHLGAKNPAVIMAKAGARGSMLNLSQMAGCVGQQEVRGERLTRGYWKRTLPHFEKEDLGAYAKGFVEHSYKTGLTPIEFFFHAMGGREGLVDTAVRTSRSGYMQRRLISALEDLKLTGDGSVRNTASTIVQFQYGEDGCDPAKGVRGDLVNIDDLFIDVLGDDADKYLALNDKDIRGSPEMEGVESEDSDEPDEDSLGDESNDYESE